MADAYASHLPVLRGLCKLIAPKQILEFGAGNHSTPFFLSTSLERLVSVETDPGWFKRIAGEYQDERLELRTDAAVIPADFDLIFIDDGDSPAQRVQTIRWVLGQEHPPVVIHDAEVAQYHTEIRELGNLRTIIFCLDMPHTALVWPEGWDMDRHEIATEVSRCTSS